jgi:hypothetical protein
LGEVKILTKRVSKLWYESCYKVALNNYHGSKPYQMGWHDRRNDNKYREYKVKNRREPLPNRNRLYNPDILAVIWKIKIMIINTRR